VEVFLVFGEEGLDEMVDSIDVFEFKFIFLQEL
jgi:hypothetical protein